ncbi:hypothetical protein ASPVEDRAFT_85410 [Aspergillus versicolor CBS 583.65]|uniref:BHLH domain-containing protein n=1 Tax=Aspergillus versicolor CBS 583.65 TaxID=1036611 RepID=A0A1L9PR60_ASPVE|nr:uncharacterized protein ASPVEDRAFT_85410 [Aspergillus versicolor CBS 583.65]OJJ03993.1 hypothetical protein ASPVEDRAFT_85410 [Aspergillus versicolor CBS 583.65]
MSNNPSTSKSKGSKKRARPLPAHVVARNLAIEKRRRGELNEDFLNLARLVPSLAHVRRLSKVLIVNESCRHLRRQRDMCISAARDMQDLLADNSRLVAEVNALRAQVGCAGIAPCAPRSITEPMTQLMSVKDEVYGKFPAGFGDNWAYQSPSSGSDENEFDDRGMEIPLDGFLELPPHYDPRQYAHNEPVVLGNDLSWNGLPAEYLDNSSDPSSSIVCMTGASMYPGITFPVSHPRDNNNPSDVPGHLDSSAVDPIHASTGIWTPGVDNGLDWSFELNTESFDSQYRQAVC